MSSERSRLSSGVGVGGGVNVGADESLAVDGDEAALGLLALSRAGVDELVDASGGGASCEEVSDHVQVVRRERDVVRGAQSRLARFKTSVAQHTGVPEEQRPAWRSSRGAAKAAVAAKARTAVMVNCMLKVDVW